MTCGAKERLPNQTELDVATLWDARTGEPVRDYYDHNRPLFVQRVAISPNSRLLAVAGKRLGNEVVTEIWDVNSGTRVAEVRPAEEEMHSLCMRFSRDSKSLMTLNATSYVRQWNVRTGGLEKEFFAAKVPANPDRTHWINAAAIAPDIQTAATSENRSIDTWNAHSGELVSTIDMTKSNPRRSFRDLAISGDGRLLAAIETTPPPATNGGLRDSTETVIRIYDRATSHELKKVDADNVFGCLQFSADGNRLAGVMRDGTALVWDVSEAERQLHK